MVFCHQNFRKKLEPRPSAKIVLFTDVKLVSSLAKIKKNKKKKDREILRVHKDSAMDFKITKSLLDAKTFLYFFTKFKIHNTRQ